MDVFNDYNQNCDSGLASNTTWKHYYIFFLKQNREYNSTKSVPPPEERDCRKNKTKDEIKEEVTTASI